MQHFESINNYQPQKDSKEQKDQKGSQTDYQQKFAQTIEEYKTHTSAIDQILAFDEDAGRILTNPEKFSEQPTLSLKPTLVEQLKLISVFFEGHEPKDSPDLLKSDPHIDL
jgi:hypothetical protein